MNCRLPQTPRSPAAAASHYFDDVFTRQRRASMSGTRRNSLARSMTRTRSIGARSDWTNGNDDNGDGDDESGQKKAPSRQWSIYKEDGDENTTGGRKGDHDDHITKYVQDQLQRLKTQDGNEYSEEIAASKS